jgi:6-pyruvoyltetrahydropterin/6-carboxytetrahydropterin synthase
MSYVLELAKEFRARQGLASPIRSMKKLPPLQPSDGYSFVLRAGITFSDGQLNEHGWFVDTDSLDAALNALTTRLGGKTWTELFPFRPTFELVARWAYRELRQTVPQLAYVELENKTLATTVQYSGKEQK